MRELLRRVTSTFFYFRSLQLWNCKRPAQKEKKQRQLRLMITPTNRLIVGARFIHSSLLPRQRLTLEMEKIDGAVNCSMTTRRSPSSIVLGSAVSIEKCLWGHLNWSLYEVSSTEHKNSHNVHGSVKTSSIKLTIRALNFISHILQPVH